MIHKRILKRNFQYARDAYINILNSIGDGYSLIENIYIIPIERHYLTLELIIYPEETYQEYNLSKIQNHIIRRDSFSSHMDLQMNIEIKDSRFYIKSNVNKYNCIVIYKDIYDT
jgi:hypothetical protein